MIESKYNEFALWVQAMTDARAVLLIVVGGDKGTGCGVRGDREALTIMAGALPELSERLKNDLRAEVGSET